MRKIRGSLYYFATSLCLAASSNAMALPLGFAGDGSEALEDSDARLGYLAPEADFTAIVALSNCSGSLVKLLNSKPEDQALILTNGHCYEGGFIDPGEVLVNRNSQRSFRLLSRDGQRNIGTLTASKLLYATMTDTDMALYQLQETYAEISEQYGVEALALSDQRPAAGTPIEVLSGYWRRSYSCAIDTFIFQLREAGWIFQDSIRYTQPGCSTVGGTSGSPIINAENRQVIGVNNTGNESGAECTLNNPCEVDAAGKIVAIKGAAYGQQTYKVYTCINAEQEFDFSLRECELPH